MSFSDYYVKQRSAKSSLFYDQINTLIDWNKIEKVINLIIIRERLFKGRDPVVVFFLSRCYYQAYGMICRILRQSLCE